MTIKVFSQKNCGPCERQKIYLRGIEYQEIDIGEDWMSGVDYMIESTPTTIIENDDGSLIARLTGVTSRGIIESYLTI